MKNFMMFLIVSLSTVLFLTGCGSSNSNSSSKKDTLIIGVDDKFAPMGFRDENNNLTGFDIEYAEAVAEEMGMTVKFQPIDWKTKETELSSGRIDLIWNGYTITDERKKKVLFTKPYLKNAQVIATLQNSDITNLKDLKGKAVGLQALSSAADALNANPISGEIKSISEYADNVLALSDLKAGRVEAVVIDEVVINYYMAKEEGSFKVIEESLAPELYGIGVKKGNEELLEKLQAAIDKVNADGTASAISEKWFGEDKILK